MGARLNQYLAAKYLLLAVEAALDDVAELLLVSELLKARLVQQGEEDRYNRTPFICVFPELEVAHDSRAWIDCVLCPWVELFIVKDFVIWNFHHSFENLNVILLEGFVLYGFLCDISNFQGLLLAQVALDEPLKADVLEPFPFHLNEFLEAQIIQNLDLIVDIGISADKDAVEIFRESGVRLLVKGVQEDIELLVLDVLKERLVRLELLERVEKLLYVILNRVIVGVECYQDMVCPRSDLGGDAGKLGHVV